MNMNQYSDYNNQTASRAGIGTTGLVMAREQPIIPEDVRRQFPLGTTAYFLGREVVVWDYSVARFRPDSEEEPGMTVAWWTGTGELQVVFVPANRVGMFVSRQPPPVQMDRYEVAKGNAERQGD